MKERNPFSKIAIFLLFLALLFSASLEAEPQARFSIVYSNDVMGEVEPCG